MNAASGSLTKRLEKKVSQVCIQRTNFGFKAQRDHTLSADCTADHLSKKGKRSRPGFRPRSKGKGYAAWDNDQQGTQLSVEKEKAKRARKERKKRILSKECLHGREKAKEMARTKEENHFNNNNNHNLHKQM